MRTLNLPDDKLAAVMAALEHSKSSTHHPKCSLKKTMHCNCHVAKAADAYDIMVKASQRNLVRAADLKVGQWISSESSLDQRIIAVESSVGTPHEVEVSVDYGGTDSRAVAEVITFSSDDQVIIIEPAAQA